MGNQFYFKCLMAVAIAIPGLGLQPSANAQVQSNISAESTINFKDRLSSPWSKAGLIHTLKSKSSINAIEFSPDGKILASVESNQIILWDTEQGVLSRILPGHYTTKYDLELTPTAIAFSPDSRFLATVTWSQGLLSPNESLIVWDVAKGEKVLGLKDSAGCRQVVFNRSREIIYGACDAGVTAWSFPQGDKLIGFDLRYPVDAIALSPNAKVIATVDANITGGQQGEKANQIQLWTLDKDLPTLLNTLDGHNNDIARIEFTADGKKLVSSSYDGKINVWNWQSGEISQKTNNLYSNNGLFSLSGDSRLIAGNFHSSAMTCLLTGLPLRNVMTTPNKKETKMLAFSPQGQLFARVKQSADSDGSEINIWQNNLSHNRQTSTIKDEYLSIDIAQYWNTQTPITKEKRQADRIKPNYTGKDPQAIALAALGLTEIVESEKEAVEINYLQDNLAVVDITQTNLPDDSIAGIRYKVKFAPYGDFEQKLWQVVWVGQQFQCYRDRGHQNWSKDFCN
ncbi:MAG: WD40 repeat domain-containing protein [Pleurocapsa sp.]